MENKTYGKALYFFCSGTYGNRGNHTDHQHGCVLAAAVDLETVAEVTLTDCDKIHIISEGYPEFFVDLKDLTVHPEERNTTASLVRGIAAAFQKKGADLKGFRDRIRTLYYRQRCG